MPSGQSENRTALRECPAANWGFGQLFLVLADTFFSCARPGAGEQKHQREAAILGAASTGDTSLVITDGKITADDAFLRTRSLLARGRSRRRTGRDLALKSLLEVEPVPLGRDSEEPDRPTASALGHRARREL
jgi:hypothetical protein